MDFHHRSPISAANMTWPFLVGFGALRRLRCSQDTCVNGGQKRCRIWRRAWAQYRFAILIEIVSCFCFFGSILWFDPRREHSSVPTAKLHSRRAQGLSRLAASSRPPEGLGLDWPEHGGMLERIGAGGRRILRWGTGGWCVAL